MPEALGRSCTDTRSGHGFAPGSRGRGPSTTADQKARKKGGADSDPVPANVRDQHGQEWRRRLAMFSGCCQPMPLLPMADLIEEFFMNKLALTAMATAALGAVATSFAYAGMTMQGPQLTGVTLQLFESSPLVVTEVTLPSGETVDLRKVAGASGR